MRDKQEPAPDSLLLGLLKELSLLEFQVRPVVLDTYHLVSALQVHVAAAGNIFVVLYALAGSQARAS